MKRSKIDLDSIVAKNEKPKSRPDPKTHRCAPPGNSTPERRDHEKVSARKPRGTEEMIVSQYLTVHRGRKMVTHHEPACEECLGSRLILETDTDLGKTVLPSLAPLDVLPDLYFLLR